MSLRVVSAAEWVPARKELQTAEQEAVRALEQIADATGPRPGVRQAAAPEKSPEGGHDK